MSNIDSPSYKEEMLANFQAATGIWNLADAFTFLDSNNWNFNEAVNKVMLDQHREQTESSIDYTAVNSFPMNFSTSVEQVDLDSPSEEMPSSFSRNAFVERSSPSTVSDPSNRASSSQSPVLDIHIQIVSDGSTDGNSFPLELPGSKTVGELQTLLYQLIGVPPCSQALVSLYPKLNIMLAVKVANGDEKEPLAWLNLHVIEVLEGFTKPVDAQTVITRDLLPKNMSILLNTGSTSYDQFQKHNGTTVNELSLSIHDEKNGKDYILPYPASKLVKEIKTDIFHLTGIPVRHQLWSGWPSEIGENTTLESLGILEDHQLKVALQPIPAERTLKPPSKIQVASSSRATVVDVSEENSSADEFEDASELLPEDDYFMCDIPSSESSLPLIPPDVEDEMCGVSSFIEKFNKRYGSFIPLFYRGTLEDALKDSVMLPAKNRKLLAVYLHHDKSVLANVFCSQSLCHISIVDYLTNNFVIWGWDLSHESNKKMLLNRISSHFGPLAAKTVKSYSVEKLPALLIINRIRRSIEILSVVHGNTNLDEVMTTLLHANEVFEGQRTTQVHEENMREQRETMKAEQDAAYHASLEADRAKAQAKKKAEMEEKVERQRQQSIKEQEDAMKEAVRASLESELPPEPGADCSEATTAFRFRAPKGDQFIRAFTRSTSLQTVLNFLCVKGFPPHEFKYLQSWPRRCITTLEGSQTLDELQMPSQETITIEERTE